MLKLSLEISNVNVATMEGGEIKSHKFVDFFKDGLNILVGVPGAFTPICTNDHLPSLIASADRLKSLGVNNIYCISDDNPWALEAWYTTLGGHEKITFLSDGNREFLDMARMATQESDLFLSGKYARFYAIIKELEIKRIRFEPSVLETACTRGDCIESDVRDFISESQAA